MVTERNRIHQKKKRMRSMSSSKEELALEVEMKKPKKRKVQNVFDGRDPGSEAEISIEKEDAGSVIVDVVIRQGPLFHDLGGMTDVIEKLKREVKTARAIANETKLPFYKIDATDIVSGVYG